MYRGRPWTIRQVAGFGQAEDTNGSYRYLLAHGETGLSTDFDLPTLLGYDSDHPVFGREVGKIGVAVDTVDDAHALFEGIPLDEVSTSLTINSPAAVPARDVSSRGRGAGHSGTQLTGTTQNDILKEYTAQNEFIFPPVRRSSSSSTQWMGRGSDAPLQPGERCGTTSVRPEATAPEEVGLTLAAALCYLERARERGIEPDRLAPRISFFWDVHNDFLEEIAKLRAARRCGPGWCANGWGAATRARGCCAPTARPAGVSLTAQQPLNNVARVAVQALAGVLRWCAVAAHQLV